VGTWDRMWSAMLTKVELEILSKRAPHGTHARYNAHLLQDEEPCDGCRDGEARYRAKLRERRLGDQGEVDYPRQSLTRTTVSRIVDEEEDEDEEEEFELDDAPADSHAASLVQTWETIGKLGFWPGLKPSSTPRGRSSRITTPSTKGNGADPRTRLRAITTELNTRKPRGPQAVKLLVEAAPYLTGGVNALAQYGEARGCHAEDIAAAERVVVGKGRR
jgi:hypothetical protein